MNPKVSVVVPVYNMEAFLEETLASIQRTRYDNTEIIVVDDGSRDTSLSIAQRFAAEDGRFAVFSQPNGGQSSALNHAIGEARGEYILPVDADNLIEPTFVERAVGVFLRGGHESLKHFARALRISIHSHRSEQLSDAVYSVAYAGKHYRVTAFDADRRWLPFATSWAAHAAACAKAAIGYVNYYCGWMLRKSYLIEEEKE